MSALGGAAEPEIGRRRQQHTGLLEAFDAHPVDAVAIEEIFRHKSSESALRLGQEAISGLPPRGEFFPVELIRGATVAPFPGGKS